MHYTFLLIFFNLCSRLVQYQCAISLHPCFSLVVLKGITFSLFSMAENKDMKKEPSENVHVFVTWVQETQRERERERVCVCVCVCVCVSVCVCVCI